MLDGRRLAWGYGPQPPLYGWLQWAFFRLIPDPLLAMALLKDALLAGTFSRSTRCSAARIRRGWRGWRREHDAAAADRLGEPAGADAFGAGTTLAALAVLVFWTRVLPRRRGADLRASALVVGLGLLAKANFLVVPLALWSGRGEPAGAAAAAAAGGDRGRRGRWRRRSCVGPAIWALRHPDVALASTFKLRRAAGARRRWRPPGAGCWRWRRRSRGFLALPAAVMAAFALALRPAGGAGAGAGAGAVPLRGWSSGWRWRRWRCW